MASSEPLVSLRNVWFAPANHPTHWIIRNASLEITSGEVILLLGHSGSGKTTLLKIIRGIIPHVIKGRWRGSTVIKGTILDETALFSLASKMGFIFQEPEFQVVGKNVLHELAFGLEVQGMNSTEIIDRVLATIEQWKLVPHAFKPLHQLSGGELRLVTLAASMITKPTLLICDELLSFLDQENKILVLESLKTMIEQVNKDISVIIATHNVEDLYPLATRIIYMENGEIRLDGAPRDVLETLEDIDYKLSPIPSYLAIERLLIKKGIINEKRQGLPSSLESLNWAEKICSFIEENLKLGEK